MADNLADRGVEDLLKMYNYLAEAAKVAQLKTFDKKKGKSALAARVRELRRKIPARIVRVAAETMLLQETPSLTYEEILLRCHAEFECSTTVACLRWYAVRMRERGEKLPPRPRSGSK
jgi:hypothetical protein